MCNPKGCVLMDLKDILIVFIVILIFGTVIFGSIGSFFSHVNTAVADVAEGVASEEAFTVDFLQENARSISNGEHLDRDFSESTSSGHSGSSGSASSRSSSSGGDSGSLSSGGYLSDRFVSSEDTSSKSGSGKDASGNSLDKNNSDDGFSFIDNIPFIDILHPMGSSKTTYEDYQVDKDTDMVDSEGNPIYLSVVSTSGGQMEPGIYEIYWSKLGIINQTRIK